MNTEQTINAGVALAQQGKLDEAEATFRQAVEADGSNPRAVLNLGVTLAARDKLDEALPLIRRSIELRKETPTAHQTLAKLLLKMSRPTEAIEAARAALHLAPDDADTHVTLARALLMSGDFRKGWAEFEWRWRLQGMANAARPFEQPRWNGVKVPDQTILLTHEQSYADAIQLLRYVPLMAERGATVIVQTPRELADLVMRMPDVAEVIPLGAPLPRFDMYIPLMSLPLAFNTTVKTIPADVPYLWPSQKIVDVWKNRLQGDSAKLHVGIGGGLTLQQLAPLAQVADVSFYLLEKALATESAETAPQGMRVTDAVPKIATYSEPAGVIANLDLVISTDSAVAHLAGAMGKPVWTMLGFSPDVRWMTGRLDTPWYPSMRLFRQPTPNDWDSPIRDVAGQLSQLAASGNAR